MGSLEREASSPPFSCVPAFPRDRTQKESSNLFLDVTDSWTVMKQIYFLCKLPSVQHSVIAGQSSVGWTHRELWYMLRSDLIYPEKCCLVGLALMTSQSFLIDWWVHRERQWKLLGRLLKKLWNAFYQVLHGNCRRQENSMYVHMPQTGFVTALHTDQLALYNGVS